MPLNVLHGAQYLAFQQSLAGKEERKIWELGRGSVSVILGGEHWGSRGCEPPSHVCFQRANRPSRTIIAPSSNTHSSYRICSLI